MTDLAKISALGLVVFATHCLEGITGFGCTVLALPFAILLLGLKTAVPVLVALSWVLSSYLVWRSYRSIQWRQFATILLYAGLGLPFGIILYDRLSEAVLKIVLGVFMIGVGVHGLWNALGAAAAAAEASTGRSPSLFLRGCLTLGGAVHGAFGTGGPFVVIYASRTLNAKSAFRGTLSLLWLSLNSLLILKWTIRGGTWTHGTGTILAGALPFLFGGMILGDRLHHHVSERAFRILVFLVLTIVGGLMLYSGAETPQP